MKRQAGISLVTATFLIVIVAMLAAFMVSIGSVQRATSTLAVVGARAHYAAASGIEWGVHQVLANPAAPVCFASPTSFPLSGAGAGNFNVTVNCAATPVTEGATSYVAFDLEAVAEFGTPGQEDYFSRRLAASVASVP